MIKSLARRLSKRIDRNPGSVLRIQERALNAVWRAFDLEMAAWAIRRPEWLRKKSPLQPLPLRTLGKCPPSRDLTERIFVKYRDLLGYKRDEEGTIWDRIKENHSGGLIQSVLEGPDALLEYGSELFRSPAVNGFSYGSTFDNWPHRWSYLPVHIELSVVQLAEYLGILRNECPDQGEIAFWMKLLSPDQLIFRIEEELGFRVEHPVFGSPRGVIFGGRFITRETCAQIYTALRMREFLGSRTALGELSIVEIGGGYGGLGYWMAKVAGDRLKNYSVVDLPEAGVIQALFLGSTLQEPVRLPGESFDARFSLVHYEDLDAIDFQPNAVINQDSMPEMPVGEVERYLGWIGSSGAKAFLSFNQEAYAENQPGSIQNSVPEMVSKFKNFRGSLESSLGIDAVTLKSYTKLSYEIANKDRRCRLKPPSRPIDFCIFDRGQYLARIDEPYPIHGRNVCPSRIRNGFNLI